MPAPFHFATIIARNYLPQAIVLVNSLRTHHPDCFFSIFVIDDLQGECRKVIEDKGAHLVLPDDLAINNFAQLVFQYGLIEACTAVKPALLQLLIDRGAKRVVYLDPDTFCYRPLAELGLLLESASMVLTPHRVSPASARSSIGDGLFLKYGSFNLGFIALRADDNSTRFLSWWNEKLEHECRARPDLNLYVDQRWLDLAPAYFDGVHVLRSPAFNLAWWNLDERTLVRRNGCWIVRETGEPLAFAHFSGIPVDSPRQVSVHFPHSIRRSPGGTPLQLENQEVLGLFTEYAGLVVEMRGEIGSRRDYGYRTYSNGEEVSAGARELFLDLQEPRGKYQDPFQTGPLTFWALARRLGYAAKRQPASPADATFRPASSGLVRSNRIIAQLMFRMLLQLITLRNAERLMRALNDEFAHVRREVRGAPDRTARDEPL